MSLRPEEDDTGSLEHARAALYNPAAPTRARARFSDTHERATPHQWEEKEKPLPVVAQRGERHVRLASIFFGSAVAFFVLSLGIIGYFFYFGGNTVSTDKISIDLQGPTTIAGGDTVPLSITITNKNGVAIDNATIEIVFPDGTRDATNVLKSYPRYIESLGTLASGATITRSIKAVVFGGAGQTLNLPVSFSYGTASSNAIFEKKVPYALMISSTPLSVSVGALTETVSGEPLTFTLMVRSNAVVPISNVVLSAALPFGFSVTSSSVPVKNNGFLIGTLAPGASKQVTLTGVLLGQNSEQRVFRFTVGTSKSSQDSTIAVTYMTQDAMITLASPFITMTLAINGDTSDTVVVSSGSTQNVSLSYANTLSTPVTNAAVTVAVSGSAIDYDSIKTANGFYNSVDHTIVFNSDTDSALASLAPGASGIGSFTFSTVPAGGVSPTVVFTTSVSGTRVGQSNVPEKVTTSTVKTAKVATTMQLSAFANPVASSGPVPPRANQATTYAVVWNVKNAGSAVAGGTVTATLPTYVSYTEITSGTGSFSYDRVTRTVTWSVGDLPQGAQAQGIFQLSLTPSTSQKGETPLLANPASFSGYDRFAGVQVRTVANPVTTETGAVAGSGIVQ